MAMSSWLRGACLDHLFRTDELDKPDFLYAGLLTSDPGPDDEGDEVSTTDTGYARQPIAVIDDSWSAPADAAGYMATHNLIPIEWDDPTGLWGTQSHWALYDQVTGGNLWYYGPILGTLREVDDGTDPVSLAAQSLTISAGQSASDYLETAWLNHTLRTATLSKPANVYAGLYSISPTDVGGVGEFTGTNYARVAIAVANASWSAPSTEGDAEKITNAGLIQWATPGSDWGTYNYVGFSDASTAGNLLMWTQMDIARLVVEDDNAPLFLAGNLAVFAS